MLMTEEEAKAKWCPMVRFHATLTDDMTPNRNVKSGDVSLCLASHCAMWRWGDAGAHNPLTNIWERLPRGYCGLAGQPVAS